MEIVLMKSSYAYANYCAAYDDCTPSCLPRFSSWRDFVNHAKTIGEEQNLVYNQKKYEYFVVEVFGSDAPEEETPNSGL